MRVTRRTLLKIFRRTRNRAAALDNPHEFATAAVGIVKNKLAEQLVEGIRYEKLDDWYEMTLFESEIETWADYIVPSMERDGAGGTHIYDGVRFDSETIEKPFIEALEKRQDVEALHQASGLVHRRDADRQLQPRLGRRHERPRRGGRPALPRPRNQGDTQPRQAAPGRKAQNSLRPENISETRWRWGNAATASSRRYPSCRTEACNAKRTPSQVPQRTHEAFNSGGPP